MNIKTKSYPNPVLGNGNDYRIPIDSKKVVSFGPLEKDKDNFYTTVKLNLDDEIILNLIKEERAAFFCDIDCVKTNYRTSEYAFAKQIRLTIPRNNVVDNVDVNCYIVAMKPIENYTHPDFNEMYEGVLCDLEEGDFLAFLGSYYLNATVKYNKCPAPSSLMQVQEASSDSGISKITFNPDNERIFIVMPHEMFELYNRVCGQNTNADELFVSTIAVDALAHALLTQRDSDTNLAANLRNLLEKINFEIDDDHPEQCFEAARKLLQEDGVDPYTTFMKKVEAVINTQPVD